MVAPARKMRWRGVGDYRDEAEALLDGPGDVAAVIRGRPRSLVMRCPDGCGETLVINLDERAGKAWRIDTRRGLTLYPSVWRESGCESHFIIWRDHILWCGRYERDNERRWYEPELEEAVLNALDDRAFRSGREVADELNELAWEVIWALETLARRGRAEEGKRAFRGQFRRVAEAPDAGG